MIATSSAGGPSLVIASGGAPDEIEVMPSWQFAAFNVAVANLDVVFRHAGDTVALPLVLTIARPGAPPIVPTAIGYVEAGGASAVSWTSDGVRRSVTVPTP